MCKNWILTYDVLNTPSGNFFHNEKTIAGGKSGKSAKFSKEHKSKKSEASDEESKSKQSKRSKSKVINGLEFSFPNIKRVREHAPDTDQG